MSMVLVTGGRGLLGALVASRLAAEGHGVRVLSRSRAPMPGYEVAAGDLGDRASLRTAVAGADVVVHCASDPRAAGEVDVEGTRRLVDAARAAGVSHLVYVSIVGVDRIPWSYYRAKHAAEGIVAGSGIGWTVQRATQFHSFVAYILARLSRAPVLLLPHGFRFQPVDAGEVADRLVDHVSAGPAGRAADFGGPEVAALPNLARAWMSAAHVRRGLLPVPVPGRLGRAFRAGANLCPEQAYGTRTWDQFLLASTGKAAQGHLPGAGPRTDAAS